MTVRDRNGRKPPCAFGMMTAHFTSAGPARMPTSRPPSLRATANWEEEVAEFFVTAGTLDRYFELQWNPLGGVFDAIIKNQMDARGVSTNFTGDWSFTAKGMKSAVKLVGTAGDSSDKDQMW